MKAAKKEQAADSFLLLARCEKYNNQLEAELQGLKSARQLFSDLDMDDREGFVLGETLLVLMSCSKRENGELEGCVGSAKLVALRMSNKREKGHLLMKLGIARAAQKFFSDAILHLKEALPLVRVKEPSAAYYEASILQNIGAIYNELEEFEESLPFHREAAKLHGRFGSTRAEAKSLCNLSVAEVMLGRWEEAEHSLGLALQKATEVGDLGTQFQAQEGLGALFYRADRLDEAKRQFELALSNLEKIGGNIGLIRERVLEKMADVIESQIKLKEKMLRIDSSEEIDGYMTSPNWFTSRSCLPPLTTSTPMVPYATLGPRYTTRLPPLDLDEGCEDVDAICDPTVPKEQPLIECTAPDMKLNFTAKSVLQEIFIFDHKKKALASGQELEKTMKSITEVLSSPGTAGTLSSNGEVFAFSTLRDNQPKTGLGPRESFATKPSSSPPPSQKLKLVAKQREDALQRAYIDTYADGGSDLSVSVTPDSSPEEGDLNMSDDNDDLPRVFSDSTNQDLLSPAHLSVSQRVREGSLAIGKDARDKFEASHKGETLMRKKKKKKRHPKDPIQLKKTVTVHGEEQADSGPTGTVLTSAATSKICVIF